MDSNSVDFNGGQNIAGSGSAVPESFKRHLRVEAGVKSVAHVEPRLGSDIAIPNQGTRALASTAIPADLMDETAPLSFVTLQAWTCSVDEVDRRAGEFTAVLHSQNNPDEIAEFSIDEVSPDDQELIEPGAVFYWNVGYSIEVSGRKMTSSVIRFRRLRYWKRRKLEQALDKAQQYKKLLSPR